MRTYTFSFFLSSLSSSSLFLCMLKTVFLRSYQNLFSKLLWYFFIILQVISMMKENIARERPRARITNAPWRWSSVSCKGPSCLSTTTLWIMAIWRRSDMCLRMVCPSQYCVMPASKRLLMSWLKLSLYGEDFLMYITV